jgi:excisionase family DNA binding protein
MSRRRKAVQPQPQPQPAVAPIPALLHDIPTTAKLMSSTTFAIRELCRAGKLRFVRVGHRWLISTEAIQKFIHDAEAA